MRLRNRIIIKKQEYGSSARSGVRYVKWLFEHWGFWLYLLLSIIIISNSKPPIPENSQITSIEDITRITENGANAKSTDPKDRKVFFMLTDITGFWQTFQSNISQKIIGYINNFARLIYANHENKILHAELAEVTTLKQRLLELEQENAELAKLLNYKQIPSSNFVTGRIIGDGGANTGQSWVVNVGQDDGVTLQSYAVDDNGLVGVIIEVGKTTSRILRLSDPNFYLPVTVRDRKFRAVLKGNASPVADLEYFDGAERPESGDMIITTGSGGNFPPYLPVGIVQIHLFGNPVVLITAEKKPPIYVKIYKKY